MFFSFSIFISDINSVGKVGSVVAIYSKDYLGYIAYIYLPILLYPLYKVNFSYIDKYIEKIISSIFLFITLIIFQALIIDTDMSGKIGNIIIDEMSPYIGNAGVWIFVLISFFISLIILLESKSEEIFENFINLKNNIFTKVKLKSVPKQPHNYQKKCKERLNLR